MDQNQLAASSSRPGSCLPGTTRTMDRRSFEVGEISNSGLNSDSLGILLLCSWRKHWDVDATLAAERLKDQQRHLLTSLPSENSCAVTEGNLKGVIVHLLRIKVAASSLNVE